MKLISLRLQHQMKCRLTLQKDLCLLRAVQLVGQCTVLVSKVLYVCF
jgi:hypothetical protein